MHGRWEFHIEQRLCHPRIEEYGKHRFAVIWNKTFSHWFCHCIIPIYYYYYNNMIIVWWWWWFLTFKCITLNVSIWEISSLSYDCSIYITSIYIWFHIHRPVNFKLRYEFVDLQQDGAAMGQDNECHRKFVSNQLDRKEPIVFRSTRNVFLFGRGGATELKYVL